MGGSKGSADPSGMYAAQASEQAAEKEYALGEQQLQWAQSVWNQEQPLVTQSEQLQINAAEQQNAFEQEQIALYNQYYAPLEKAYVGQVQNWASPANTALVTGQATSTIANNVNQGIDTAKKELEAYGVNPSDPRYAGLYIGANTMGAAGEAAAGTTAAQNLKLQQMAMEGQAINTGRGLVNSTPGMTNAAAGAGSGAASTGQQNLSTGSNAFTAPVNWFNSGATNMGVYTNAVNAYNTTNLGYAQLGAQEMSGIGSMLGDITGMFAPIKFAAKGGPVALAKGGAVFSPVTRFAAAGAVAQNPSAITSQQEENALHQAIGYGPTSTVASLQASYNAMTPEQQAWYTSQNAALQGYLGAGQAAGASYTPATGGFGGQAPTVNSGQLALANNQKSMYQGEFNITEPTATPAATSSPVPAPYVAPPNRVSTTVAPIGGSTVKFNFTPPKTANSSPTFAPAGSGSSSDTTNPNATTVSNPNNPNASNPATASNPNAANTSANPNLANSTQGQWMPGIFNNMGVKSGFGNSQQQGSGSTSPLVTALTGFVDQNQKRNGWGSNWGSGNAAGFARGGGVNPQAGQSPIPIPAGSTPGGPIPPHASPSMGAATDDVPSMLTAGEFVIPKDVAQWKGHEHFVKAIDKARMEQHEMKNRGDIGGEPARAPPQRPTFVSRPSPIPLRRFG